LARIRPRRRYASGSPFPDAWDGAQRSGGRSWTQRSKAAKRRSFFTAAKACTASRRVGALDPGSGSAALHPPGKDRWSKQR
jgi:hypothetical protein